MSISDALIFRDFKEAQEFFTSQTGFLKSSTKNRMIYYKESGITDFNFIFMIVGQGMIGAQSLGAVESKLMGAACRVIRIPDKIKIATKVFTMAIGFFLGMNMATNAVYNSERVTIWRNEKMEKSFENLLDIEFEKDTVLEQLICPLSLYVPNEPVRCPIGNLYDCESLEKIPASSTGEIKDPKGNGYFLLKDAFRDYESSIVILRRKLTILPNQIEQHKERSPAWKFLVEKKAILERRLHENFSMAFQQLELFKKNNQYDEQLQKFQELFGEEAFSEIDWEKDWDTILKDRWKEYDSLKKENT